MKNFLYVLLLVVILTVGCRQTETTAKIPTTKNDEVKTTAMRVSVAGTDAAEPAIAADSDGSFYVLYVAHEAEKSADIFLQKFDSQRKAIGERVRVNPNSGEATAWRGDPPTIAVGADKTVYVGWTKTVKSDAGSGRDLCLSVSRDGGKSFAAPVKVNDDTAPASHGMHSLAVGKNKAIYLAWLDERNLKSEHHAENFNGQNSVDSEFQFVKVHHNSNHSEQAETKKDAKKHEEIEPNSEIFFAASADGGKTFSANLKLSSEVCPCCKTALAVAPDGRIYASWRQVLNGDFRHIAVASSNDAGKTFAAPTIVSDDRWKINACPVSGAAMSADKNNRLKVAWFTGGEAGKIGLYEAESNDFGATFTDRILVSESEVSGTPTFSTDGDNFKILWEADGKIYQSQSSASRDFTKPELSVAGNLPSAVAFGGKLFAVFINKENEKRAVWLAEF